jgi:hypothetical protein
MQRLFASFAAALVLIAIAGWFWLRSKAMSAPEPA